MSEYYLLDTPNCGPLVDLDHLFRDRCPPQNGPGEPNDSSGGGPSIPVISFPYEVRAAWWQEMLSDIWLPDGFTWEEPQTQVVRGNTFPMVFTPGDTVNYKTLRQNIMVNVIEDSTTHFGNFVEGEMVWIPAGTFRMGQYNIALAAPAHQVTLTKGFYIGATEVTQEQWYAVMIDNINNISANPSWFTYTQVGQNTDNFPVEQVSWYDILVFANMLSLARGLSPAYKIGGSTNPDEWGTVPTSWNATWDAVEVVANSTGYRLPTEAQWEYATRAGTTTQWSFGDSSADAGEYMWFSQNSQDRTQEVGTRRANPWGLYDMHGNVMEWVWCSFEYYTSDTRTNPATAVPGAFRILRGGGWNEGAEFTRSAVRSYAAPYAGWDDFGFRLVRGAKPQ